MDKTLNKRRVFCPCGAYIYSDGERENTQARRKITAVINVNAVTEYGDT